jgi:hypothetical protein
MRALPAWDAGPEGVILSDSAGVDEGDLTLAGLGGVQVHGDADSTQAGSSWGECPSCLGMTSFAVYAARSGPLSIRLPVSG